MPPKPISTAALVLELGTVCGCIMTAGSGDLQLSAALLTGTSADVGLTVTVVGAGVVTGDPDTSALFRSTIATAISVSECILADVAITSVIPIAACGRSRGSRFGCTIHRSGIYSAAIST